MSAPDAAGSLLGHNRQRYHHSPFGQVLEGGDAKNRYGFSGKESFDDGKLLDFGPRMMGPEAGRFLGPDPLEPELATPQSLNRYLYVRNNPLSDSDLCGEMSAQEAVDWLYSDILEPLDELAPAAAPIAEAALEVAANTAAGFGDTVTSGMGLADDSLTAMARRAAGGDNVDKDSASYTVGEVSAHVWAAVLVGAASGGAGATAGGGGAVEGTLWPGLGSGRQAINGFEYSEHALMRMAPRGLGGRGVPVSVVEDVIANGAKSAGHGTGELVHSLGNVKVVRSAKGLIKTVIH